LTEPGPPGVDLFEGGVFGWLRQAFHVAELSAIRGLTTPELSGRGSGTGVEGFQVGKPGPRIAPDVGSSQAANSVNRNRDIALFIDGPRPSSGRRLLGPGPGSGRGLLSGRCCPGPGAP
jgi:hypothetical protein